MKEPKQKWFVADGVANKVSYTVNNKKVTKKINGVMMPGTVPGNEGLSAKGDLETAERFKMRIDAFLVEKMLHQIVDGYFPNKDKK